MPACECVLTELYKVVPDFIDFLDVDSVFFVALFLLIINNTVFICYKRNKFFTPTLKKSEQIKTQ